MPFTYFAHQVPVLPLKMRAPRRWDGLGLVVGSMLPDLWRITSGWLFGPGGMPLWTDGHRLDLIVQNCVIPGYLLTVLLRRWTMPVVPAVLPKGGFLRLRDYRLLALSHHRWWVTAYSVFVGALTHIVLDAFTHADGFVVEAVPAMSNPLFSVGGRSVALYKLLQFGGHVFGSIAGAWLLLVISRRKLQWTWHGYATRPPDPVIEGRGAEIIQGMLAVGTILATAYGILRVAEGDGGVPGFMAFSCVMILTVLVAGRVGRRWVQPLPAPGDPLVE
ncbi:MAG: DUF4184 family protein [Acidimicrobiales bacterium]